MYLPRLVPARLLTVPGPDLAPHSVASDPGAAPPISAFAAPERFAKFGYFFEHHFVVAQKSHTTVANFGNFMLPEVAKIGDFKHCNCFQKLPKVEPFYARSCQNWLMLGSPIVSKIDFVTYT